MLALMGLHPHPQRPGGAAHARGLHRLADRAESANLVRAGTDVASPLCGGSLGDGGRRRFRQPTRQAQDATT